MEKKLKKPSSTKSAPAKKSGMKFVGLLIEEGLHERIRKQAKAEGGSVSFLIRRACKQTYEPHAADEEKQTRSAKISA